MERHFKVFLEPSLLQAEQIQLSSIGRVFQMSLCWGLNKTELDAVLKVGCHKSRVEGKNNVLWPAGHSAFDTVWDRVDCLSCKCTLLHCVELHINQHPPKSFYPGLLSIILRTACTHFWDCPDLAAGSRTWPHWNLKGFHGPIYQDCQDLSGQHLFLPAHQLQPTAWCHWETCWGCTRSLPFASVVWLVCLDHLSLKIEAKKIIKYLSLLHIPTTQISHFLPELVHIFLSLGFITNTPIEAFLIVRDILARLNSIKALALPTWSLAAQAISSCSSQATCPCFHPL